ncbi:MAG: LysM peptidoglycan-binding domain-containing protein [Gammaproteobacteria bacterium]|nr:LysM peptidoglycan-binding domain-containing protein [Gammaproteobacteria bacterium]
MNTQKIKRNTIQHTINESSQTLVTETVIEKSQKIITIDTQNHQIIIHQRAEDQAPATTTVANNTLPEDILFIHAIVKGDTLWRIARQYLNDPYLYPELAKLSNINNPNLIYPGDVVKMKKKHIHQ